MMTLHKGSCHCKAVTFTVRAPSDLLASYCNCSICKATGFVHLIVDKDDFTLLTGKDDISIYTFNTGTAKHTFCKHCGIKSFYTPRTHPNGFSINVNCLDHKTINSITYTDFDGANWEASVDDFKQRLT